MKKINRHVSVISVQWLKSLMPNEEEADKITLDNYKNFLNQSPFYFRDNQIFNSSFTEKWTRRKLKKLFRRNPSKAIDSYNYSDLV
jgi:DNA-binding LacI/PurR family transcriptional regulator